MDPGVPASLLIDDDPRLVEDRSDDNGADGVSVVAAVAEEEVEPDGVVADGRGASFCGRSGPTYSILSMSIAGRRSAHIIVDGSSGQTVTDLRVWGAVWVVVLLVGQDDCVRALWKIIRGESDCRHLLSIQWPVSVEELLCTVVQNDGVVTHTLARSVIVQPKQSGETYFVRNEPQSVMSPPSQLNVALHPSALHEWNSPPRYLSSAQSPIRNISIQKRVAGSSSALDLPVWLFRQTPL